MGVLEQVLCCVHTWSGRVYWKRRVGMFDRAPPSHTPAHWDSPQHRVQIPPGAWSDGVSGGSGCGATTCPCEIWSQMLHTSSCEPLLCKQHPRKYFKKMASMLTWGFCRPYEALGCMLVSTPHHLLQLFKTVKPNTITRRVQHRFVQCTIL